MAKKTHRTANGNEIDMGSLVLKNEETIAVGNMGVNARGDKLGPGGKIVKSKDELMKEHYTVKNSIIPGDAAPATDRTNPNTGEIIQGFDPEYNQPGPVVEPIQEDTESEPEANESTDTEDTNANVDVDESMDMSEILDTSLADNIEKFTTTKNKNKDK